MGDRWDRLWDLFGRASDMGEAERLELLASVRENDPELGGELEEMLAQHARHGVLDNAPLVGSDEFEDPLLGQTIGPYRIESLLGQGGMGAVYLASQSEPVQRSVALKLIRDSLDPQAVLPRFERERRALALMQHSAIAAIYDAGQTDTGRPYFVMELVEGKPITAFCDDARLGVKQRVQLFQQVCRGVHHAHQKGIIHRDLKPSNILVTEQDGDPCPKVIDFGIARAVRTVEDGEARQTRVGTVVGTPEYMSPEQADSRGADVDTRSDVYSLSCVLYELLTGALPHDPDTLRRADAATLQRILDEERPPTPSQKLDTVRESETIARTRNTSRGTLREQLRGDLDWIVMKGLENDRSRRYESAAALADDLARHLEHRPVEATPPSLSYVTGKFIRRYRVAVGATVAVVLGMLIALGGVTVGLLRTAQALKEANRQRQKASHVQSVLEQAFTQIDPLEAQGRDTSLLVEILVATGERIDRELANNPDAAGELHLTVARAYKMLGDSEGTERHAGRAVELLGEVLGEQAPQTLAARNLLALAYWEQGRHAEAEALHRSVYESRARALGPEHADTLTSLNNLALAVKNRGDVQTAAELFERCLADRRRTLGATHPSTVIVMSNLARAREDLEQFEEAEELMREIVRIETESFGEDDARTLHSRDILGGVVASAGRLEEAEQLHREALAGMRRVYGERHPTTLGSMYNLGKLQIKAARFDEAETTLRSVSDIVREDHGDDHRYARLAGQHLAQAICAQPGRQAEGLAEFDRLQRLDTASRDEPDPDWAMVDLRHGECLIAAGRNDAAELRLRQALTDLTRLHGEDDRRSRQAADALSRLARSD